MLVNLEKYLANLETEKTRDQERKENTKASLYKIAAEIYKIAPELDAEIQRNFTSKKINIFEAKKQITGLKEGLSIIDMLVTSTTPDYTELNGYLSRNHPNTRAWKKFKAALCITSGVLVITGSGFALTTPAWPIFFPGFYFSVVLIEQGTKMWKKANEDHPFGRSNINNRFFGKMSEMKKPSKKKTPLQEIESHSTLPSEKELSLAPS